MLEQKLGPLRIRAWGLLLNFIANAAALYGLSQVLSDNGGHALMIGGIVLTVAIVAVLAIPSSGASSR
ncbi:MAG: hypothetical protein AAF292_07660 [Pseudomonadota bacterium]